MDNIKILFKLVCPFESETNLIFLALFYVPYCFGVMLSSFLIRTLSVCVAQTFWENTRQLPFNTPTTEVGGILPHR